MAEAVRKETVEKEAVEKEEVRKFYDDKGNEISRSAYIRQEFKKNRSRGEIAKELDVPYYIVYAATANMYNEKHPEGGGVKVNRGVILEDGRSRAEHMREMFMEGKSRGEIAKHFNVPYATVYAVTKDLDAPGEKVHGGKVMVDLEDGTTMPRVDYIRKRFSEGASRREIANELGCDYAIVWAATRPKKKQEEADEVNAELNEVQVAEESEEPEEGLDLEAQAGVEDLPDEEDENDPDA